MLMQDSQKESSMTHLDDLLPTQLRLLPPLHPFRPVDGQLYELLQVRRRLELDAREATELTKPELVKQLLPARAGEGEKG